MKVGFEGVLITWACYLQFCLFLSRGSNVLVSGSICSPRYPSVRIVDTRSTLDINQSLSENLIGLDPYILNSSSYLDPI